MKYLIILFSGLLSLFSCKPASYTLQDYTGKRLSVANGGGFTGQVIEYTIFENGQVFRKNSLTKSTEEQQRLNKEIVDQIFINYDFLNLGDIKYDEPGNMYFYIEMDNPELSHKIQWNNDSGDDVDKHVKIFYKTVLNSVKKN